MRGVARAAGEYIATLSRAVIAGAVHDAAAAASWLGHFAVGQKLSGGTVQMTDVTEVAQTFSLVPERVQVFVA